MSKKTSVGFKSAGYVVEVYAGGLLANRKLFGSKEEAVEYTKDYPSILFETKVYKLEITGEL